MQVGSRVIPPTTVTTTQPAITIPTPKPTTAAQTTTWTVSDKRLSLSYPSQWRATRDVSDQYSILELDSPDSVFFYLSAYVPGSPAAAKSALDGIQGYKDRQAKSTARRVISQGAIQQTTVNGR